MQLTGQWGVMKRVLEEHSPLLRQKAQLVLASRHVKASCPAAGPARLRRRKVESFANDLIRRLSQGSRTMPSSTRKHGSGSK